MILVWGRPGDAPTAAIARELMVLDATVLAFDTTDVERVDPSPSASSAHEGRLVLRGDHQIDLGAVTGAYLRPNRVPSEPAQLEAVDALLAWSELTPAVIVNRPAAAASNHSKPYQARLIAEAGFAVPETLVTTDSDAALDFWSEHDAVIYKSISGVRSIVARLGPADRERLVDVASCPVQFQQYVEGTDHRVHVVGGEVFACRVDSPAVDYRYSPVATALGVEPIDLPRDVAERCVALVACLGLEFAGIDLRLDPDGRWWCFEANTAPGFTWYEDRAQLRIAAAVAQRLVSGTAA